MITWIGLAHVKPRTGIDVLGGAVGAFVVVVGFAQTDAEFAQNVAACFDMLELDVLEVVDIEPWEKRSARCAVADDVAALVQTLTLEQRVATGTFDAYERI